MNKIIGMILGVGVACAANAAIIGSAVGDGDGYDITGSEVAGFRSTSVTKKFDVGVADGAYGSDGYLVFGGPGSVLNGEGFDGASTFLSNPTFGTFVEGRHFASVSRSIDYPTYDNPSLPIGATVEDVGASAVGIHYTNEPGTWHNLVTLNIDNTAPSSFRIGVMGGTENTADGRWDSLGYRLVLDGTTVLGSAVTVPEILNKTGMVFFDVSVTDGTTGYIEFQMNENANSKVSISGVTIDVISTDFKTTGLWTTAVNWTAGVPGDLTTSVILGGAKATLDTAASVGNLTVADTATLNIADDGVLTASADVTFEAGSTYQVGIGATSCGKIDVGGDLTITDAILDLDTMQGTQRTIAVFDGTLTGEFKDASNNTLSNGSELPPAGSGNWIHYVTDDTGRNFIAITTSVIAPSSSGVDVRAYQGSEGVIVEFVAYDVESDGVIQLALMGADGQAIWTGSVDAAAGPRYFARFLVPGLELGATYDFQVRDEVGKWWKANGVTVETFAAEMTSLSLAGVTVEFDSLPDHDYEIQWVDQLGGTWLTIDTVTASGAKTSAVVAYPESEEPSGFFRVLAK